MLKNEVRAAIEAILFAAGDPVTAAELSRVLHLPQGELISFLEEMKQEYNEERSGIRLVCSPHGYALCTKQEYSELIVALNLGTQRRISDAAMETLAIIAYRQPVTRADIEMIRGVKSDRAIASLMSRNLIREVGRKESIGRPVLYGTTDEFLQAFGLESLDELPDLESKEAPSVGEVS